MPIILDDDDDDTPPGTPDSDAGQLPDLLDLFSSDPVECVEFVSRSASVKVKVDRKGKGKAVEAALPVHRPGPERVTSPDFEGIEEVGDATSTAKRKTKLVQVERPGKRARTVTPDLVSLRFIPTATG